MTHEYKSGYESQIAATLTRARVRFKYEPYNLPFHLKARSATCSKCGNREVYVARNYKPDWVSEDDTLIVESKGKFTPADRTKMLAVIAAHPEKDIRLLFMRDNWLTRKKQQKYSEWCEKHGITYAIGDMPKEWIKDFKAHQLKGIGEASKRKRKGISG